MISGELAREMDFFSLGTNDQHSIHWQWIVLIGELQDIIIQSISLIKMIRIVANNVHLEGKQLVSGDLAA